MTPLLTVPANPAATSDLRLCKQVFRGAAAPLPFPESRHWIPGTANRKRFPPTTPFIRKD